MLRRYSAVDSAERSLLRRNGAVDSNMRREDLLIRCVSLQLCAFAQAPFCQLR